MLRLRQLSTPFPGIANQLPRVAAQAVNQAAFAARAAGAAEVQRAFRRPATAIIRATKVVERATVRSPRAVVALHHPDPAFQRRLDVIGGMNESGGIETPGMVGRRTFAVPVGARVNASGSMSRGAVARLLAQRNVFILDNGRSTEGIYRVTGRGSSQRITLLVRFADRLRYRPRLHWHAAVERGAATAIGPAVDAAMRQAMAGTLGRAGGGQGGGAP